MDRQKPFRRMTSWPPSMQLYVGEEGGMTNFAMSPKGI